MPISIKELHTNQKRHRIAIYAIVGFCIILSLSLIIFISAQSAIDQHTSYTNDAKATGTGSPLNNSITNSISPIFGAQVVGADGKNQLPGPDLMNSMNIKATVLWLYYPGANADLRRWVINEKNLVEGVQNKTGIKDIRIHIMPNDRPQPFHMPADMETYTKALTALANSLKDDGVTYYSIGNEFSSYTWADGIDNYVILLKESGKAIKAGNPNAIILDSGMAGMTYVFAIANTMVQQGDSNGALSFVQAFLAHHTSWKIPTTIDELKAGLTNPTGQADIKWHAATFTSLCPYYDVLQLHDYQGWETMETVFNWIKSQMQANKCVKPIQFWEMGYGLDAQFNFDPAEQARSVVKMLTISTAQGSELIHYFPFRSVNNFYARGLTYGDNFQLLPAGTAFKIASSKLSGMAFKEKLNLGTNVSAYSFKYNGKEINIAKEVYIIWGTASPLGSPPTITLPFHGAATVTDILGNSNVVTSGKITVSSSPVFVEPEM